MDKQYIIEKLINKGIYKIGKRQLWELSVKELAFLLQKNESKYKEDT
ncbi:MULTISPECIES: Fur-regulated basic protein FbpA [Bacillus cereus group]|uniref:Fur-regulated basic protein FbpA n=1 Tax=Bacillus cereus TaxID=1396 RepID=A0A9W7QK67_BACCE|nr:MULTISPECIES: Fur-regulated basic protein FbpA [Bacillus cereus group]KAB2400715.1 Fur-regulated basic protein FbpA [Bacillus cereus]KAB2410959.1 Fur-regulated basic protein FbpA [Bacillus cereus]KAB2431038.1 Fur-regulated basic protein FbpA [Bacillus cereus]KLA36093.1 hypothetical protein B4158_5854 [Bacillus cereus]MBU0451110.1 Fur-regulated basic protein FbpA [Bacillus thuringiensis]